MNKGSLIVVGSGIKLAAQCTPEARAAIEAADIVFAVVDPVTLHWLGGINQRVVSMQLHYAAGRSRRETYERMTQSIMEAVRSGKRTCAVFYGHPGVFVRPSNAAIEAAREEGYEAFMLPGISAEDCLYADLGFDPGLGLQGYEAHDFFIHARVIDPSAALVLWQIAVIGDTGFTEFEADRRRLALLARALMEIYPAHHEVILYEAASLPTHKPRIEALELGALEAAQVTQESTLFVPPLKPVSVSPARLALLEAALNEASPPQAPKAM